MLQCDFCIQGQKHSLYVLLLDTSEDNISLNPVLKIPVFQRGTKIDKLF